MKSIINKRYHHKLVKNNEFDCELHAIKNVFELKAQGQLLQSSNEQSIQDLDIMSTNVK